MSEKKNSLISILLVAFVTLAAGGYVLARYSSPDYRASERAAQEWVAEYSELAPSGVTYFGLPEAGRQIVYHYVCDQQQFVYNATKDTVTVERAEGPEPPRPQRPFPFIETIAFVAARSNFTSVAVDSKVLWESTPASSRPALMFKAALAAISGVGVGYYMGYEQRLDCKEGYTQGYLKSVPFWQQVEAIREERAVRLQRRFRFSDPPPPQ